MFKIGLAMSKQDVNVSKGRSIKGSKLERCPHSVWGRQTCNCKSRAFFLTSRVEKNGNLAGIFTGDHTETEQIDPLLLLAIDFPDDYGRKSDDFE